MFNPNTFIVETEALYHKNNQGQRKGQFYYNRFRTLFPNLRIPDSVDCFYDDKKLSEFVEFVFNVTL